MNRKRRQKPILVLVNHMTLNSINNTQT